MGSTTIQAVVTSIDSIPGCASSLTTQTIIDGIADGVNGDVVGRLNANQIPPCSGSFPFQKLELRIPACMKLVSEGSNRKGLVMCNETSTAYCEMICDLCHNGSVIDRINCIHTLDGTPDCGGGSAPTNFSDWSLNTCYQIPCGTE